MDALSLDLLASTKIALGLASAQTLITEIAKRVLRKCFVFDGKILFLRLSSFLSKTSVILLNLSAFLDLSSQTSGKPRAAKESTGFVVKEGLRRFHFPSQDDKRGVGTETSRGYRFFVCHHSSFLETGRGRNIDWCGACPKRKIR